MNDSIAQYVDDQVGLEPLFRVVAFLALHPYESSTKPNYNMYTVIKYTTYSSGSGITFRA